MTKHFSLVLWLLTFSPCGMCAAKPEQHDKQSANHSSATIPAPIHGVTVASAKDFRTTAYLNQVVRSLGNLTSTPTVRLEFRLEGSDRDKGAKAKTYLSATQAISKTAYILGEVIDSAYEFCFDVADHEARWNDYVSTLGEYVDIWEVGNEINGNWLDNSDPISTKGQSCPWAIPNTTERDVVTKMVNAYHIVKKAGKKAALTLYYEPNPACTTSMGPKYDPVIWATKNIPAEMKEGLDYVLLSSYRDKCPDFRPDFNALFTRFHKIFPNSKLGMGEWGYSHGRPNQADLTRLLNDGYSVHPEVPNWVGGVFFWEWGDDAVPYDSRPGSIWNVVNTNFSKQ